MCNSTRRYASKKSAAMAALAEVSKSLTAETSRPKACIAVVNAACGATVVDDSGRIRQEKRSFGYRVKLPVFGGVKIFGPALYNAYKILSAYDLDHIVQLVHDKDVGSVIVTFTTK